MISALAAAAAASGSTSQPTRLSITVYPHGRSNPFVHRYELRCGPAGGNLPRPIRACQSLTSLPHPFAPVPRGQICAQIALGPQEAIVTGLVGGRHVWARLRLRDSCQIARWRRLAKVVPVPVSRR
ncbi:MAG TPA: hypothetical protein VFU56_03065 [Gaiellaceae bacterium]|nr:hypothetical protein [Gaiellaceae bacterium]